MTKHFQVDDPTVLLYDSTVPDEAQTHFSVGTLRKLAAQMQSKGSAKLRSRLQTKLHEGQRITRDIIDNTLINASKP